MPECVQYLNGVLYLAADLSSTATTDNEAPLAHYESSTLYEAFKRTKLSLLVRNKV